MQVAAELAAQFSMALADGLAATREIAALQVGEHGDTLIVVETMSCVPMSPVLCFLFPSFEEIAPERQKLTDVFGAAAVVQDGHLPGGPVPTRPCRRSNPPTPGRHQWGRSPRRRARLDLPAFVTQLPPDHLEGRVASTSATQLPNRHRTGSLAPAPPFQ